MHEPQESGSFWPTAGTTELPSADAYLSLLASVDFAVPSRSAGRRREHREGYCVIRALRWLCTNRHRAFPASLIRQEQPDFILRSRDNDLVWALEHTDAGEQAFQHWLSKVDRQPGASFLPSPGGDGWVGAGPELAFANAIGAAIERKSAPKFWQNAPDRCVRCVLLHDQTNSGLFVSDRDAQNALAASMAKASTAAGRPTVAMLVRGADRVLVAGAY